MNGVRVYYRPGQTRLARAFWQCFDDSPAFVLLCLLALSMPLENSVTLPGLGTGSRLLGMLVIGAAGLEVILGRALRPPGAELLPLALFVAWSAITYFWSFEPEVTADRLATNLRLLLLVWVVWQCARTVPLQERLMQFFLAGASGAALDTVMKSRWNQAIDEIRFAGAGWDPNELGLILALSIGVAVFLAAKSRGAIAMLLYGAHMLLAFWAILLTGSRGSALAFCAGGAVMVWFRLREGRSITPASVAVVVAATLLCLALIPEATWDRLRTIQEEVSSGTFTKRKLIWQAGVEAFFEHPIFGAGAGTFGYVMMTMLDQGHSAHNTYLSVLLETGLIGFALLCAVVITCATATLRLPFTERRLWCTVLVMLAVGISSLTWEYKKTLWFLLALLLSRGDLTPLQPAHRLARRAVVKGAGA